MSFFTPKQIAAEFLENGIYKTQLPTAKFILLAFLGGAFIAFGGLLSVMVAGGMPGIGAENPGLIRFVAGALFPIGLIIVVVAGADLFTSNCATFVYPLFERATSPVVLIKVLVLSYVFNFVGAQFVAFLLASKVGILKLDPWREYLHTYATGKVTKEFYIVFLKGIGANWLVCLSIWMGTAAKDIIGKSVGIWMPVMLFVTLGYEHSIANMFFIPAAIYSGADISWSIFLFKNLFPCTLGNIVGGALFVGCLYWYTYLKGNSIAHNQAIK